MKKYFNKKNTLAALLVIVAISTLMIFAWVETPYQAQPEALDALNSTENFLVNQNNNIVFTPAKPFNSGVIFYPGDRIDPKSYAPLCKFLAEEQHVCVIIPMPLNLSIFGENKADEVIRDFPNIHYWIIAGHSQGGTVAAKYVKSHESNPDIKGIALLGSSLNVDLSNNLILVSSFRGTNDGIFSKDTWESTKNKLPLKYSTFIEIQGGNHSQFGYYGFQIGDNEATISHEEQFRIFEDAIHDMLPEH